MSAPKWMLYGRAPSLDTFWDEELNLGRVPATDEAIAAAEARLGIRLPAWLRQLYARYDGGAVRMWQMELSEPDDWHKTEPLFPRARLLGAGELFSFAEVRQREGYRDDAYTALVGGGDDARLIVIATDDWSPARALCLDYSDIGEDEPVIVLVQTDGSDHRRMVFDGIDDVLTRLVRIEYCTPALTSGYDAVLNWELEPPSLASFWSGPGRWGGGSKPASEALITATEQRLGLRLPALLKQLYHMQDGGPTEYTWASLRRQPSARLPDWEDVVVDGSLHPLAHLQTLAGLMSISEDGTEAYSFARRYAHIDWIVPLATHNIEWMLCLDYRANGPDAEPEVVYFEYFGELISKYRARSFDAFFANLRKGELE